MSSSITTRRSFHLALVGGAAGALLVPLALVAGPAAGAQGAAPSSALPVQAGASQTDGLPDWFDANRVHAHTRLGVGGHWSDGQGSNEFDNAAEGIVDLGANVLGRHFKTQDEDPWWPSGAPLGPDGERLFDDDRLNVWGATEVPVPAGTDLPAEIVADVDAHDVGLIAYYWHHSNRRVGESNPEWVCHTFEGEVNSHPSKGPFLDWGATGYGDIVKTHLVELAEKGVQGFYFDNQQDPPGGCRTPAADAAFTAATGLQPPTAQDYGDPVYHEWIKFRTDQRIAVFQEWRDAVGQVQPESVFAVSMTNLPALTLPWSGSSRWAEAVDSVKSEYHIPIRPGRVGSVFDNNPDLARPEADVQLSLGWATLRDLSANGVPHNWVVTLPNTEYVLGSIGSMAAHGHITNLDVGEGKIFEPETQPQRTPRDAMIAGFDLGNRISPYLAGMTAERWAAVHFSESQREARMIGQPTNSDALSAAWEEVLWPLTGAYSVLARAGVPTGVVSDAGLSAEGLAGYRLLFLPHRDDLTADQEAAVAAWEADGGVVVENDPAWQWADPAQNEAAHTALAQTVQPYLDDAQVSVTGGPERMYATAFTPQDGNGSANPLSVAITNDFSHIERVPADTPPEDVPPPPPAASGVEVEFDAELLGCSDPQACPAPNIFDAVTDTPLDFELTATGYRVHVPDFDHLAVVTVDQSSPTCDQVIDTDHAGPLEVSSGVTCLEGATVSGKVTVGAGASLIATDSTINGSHVATDPARVELINSNVRGRVSITGTTDGVWITESSIVGRTDVSDNTTTESVVIQGTSITGTLTCNGNDPAPTNDGQPNTVTGSKRGQCSDL